MANVNNTDLDLATQPITQWLRRVQSGDHDAQARLYDAVYPVLRRMAAGKVGVEAGATVSPTMVVNELFLKIADSSVLDSQDRHHFYATCSRAMRFIVTDFARSALSQKRGAGSDHCEFTTALASQPDRAQELLDIDSALHDLESVDPRLRELVELKFFGGLTHGEIGDLLQLSERTIKRDWVRARAFLVARTSAENHS